MGRRGRTGFLESIGLYSTPPGHYAGKRMPERNAPLEKIVSRNGSQNLHAWVVPPPGGRAAAQRRIDQTPISLQDVVPYEDMAYHGKEQVTRPEYSDTATVEPTPRALKPTDLPYLQQMQLRIERLPKIYPLKVPHSRARPFQVKEKIT